MINAAALALYLAATHYSNVPDMHDWGTTVVGAGLEACAGQLCIQGELGTPATRHQDIYHTGDKWRPGDPVGGLRIRYNLWRSK